MASASTFERHYVATTSYIRVQRFHERKHRQMISHGRNAFQCEVMHANQGPVKAFSSKSHVQTARKSHDLNMGFAASNNFA